MAANFVESDFEAGKIVASTPCDPGSPLGKILGIVRAALSRWSYSATQTYPRPSHPDAAMRMPPYFTLVAALISVRTTLENERLATRRFLDRFPTPESVLAAEESALAETLHPAGMPEKRAKTIVGATRFFVREIGGEWGNVRALPLADARQRLKDIPGVGEKVADCVLELGLEYPTIVVDVNVFRVIARLFALIPEGDMDSADPSQVAKVKSVLDGCAVTDPFLCRVIHTMVLLHGKNVCGKKKRCGECAVREGCPRNDFLS